MAEDIVFDGVAPVVPVRDLDVAIGRYRRLGFARWLRAPLRRTPSS